MSNFEVFDTLTDLAKYFKTILRSKKYILLFAYNGTGKTRLSCEFKNLSKNSAKTKDKGDTLYYNAFTEDLFTWNNDLENNTDRKLIINQESKFFNGLQELSMEDKIREHLNRYADFKFKINYEDWSVNFSKDLKDGEKSVTIDNIKISRAEEYIFIWCFFLAIVELVIEGNEAYKWVKYLYIDDPISSLDDNNAIAVANHLVQIINQQENLKVIISTHHSLFFNVIYNEFKRTKGNDFMLLKDRENSKYIIQDTNDTPFFYHVSMLKELQKAVKTGRLYTYHFNILRNILEKSANFHGFKDFTECIKKEESDIDDSTFARYINILSHSNYSLYEPKEMVEDNKKIFKDILERHLNIYKYNSKLFEETQLEEE